MILDQSEVEEIQPQSPIDLVFQELEKEIKSLVTVHDKTPIIDPKKEGLLMQLIRFDKRWEILMEKTRASLVNELQINGLKSAQGALVKVTLSESGSKYAFDDIGMVDSAFIQAKFNPNPEAIETYLKEHGELPLGVVLNENRTVYAAIRPAKVKQNETE